VTIKAQAQAQERRVGNKTKKFQKKHTGKQQRQARFCGQDLFHSRIKEKKIKISKNIYEILWREKKRKQKQFTALNKLGYPRKKKRVFATQQL